MKLLRHTSQILGLCSILLSSMFSTVHAEGAHQILFDLKDGKSYVDGNQIPLDVSPALIENRLYVPVRFLSQNLGFEVDWDAGTNMITMQLKDKVVIIDPTNNQATIDHQSVPFNQVGVMIQDRLLLAARTMAELTDRPINYDSSSHVVTITPVPAVNHPPVASFSTDKDTYRVGEPIQYIDASSDVDGDSITTSWMGKEAVFFTPGDHVVTLTAKDSQGMESKPYRKTIKVTNEVFTTPDEYPFYFGALTGNPKALPVDLDQVVNYPLLTPREERDSTRKLIFSDSPEIISQYGILYKEKINGKARIYLTNQNGMANSLRVNVMVTNSTDHPITLRTARIGDTPASYRPEILGNIALLDWYRAGRQDSLVVAPGQSQIYYQSPVLLPNEAVHSIRDIEADGDLTLTFIAAGENDDATQLKDLPILPGHDGHDRGTFDVSGIYWDFDGKLLNGNPANIAVGEEGYASKQWVRGKDALTGQPVVDLGNYGVFYDLTIHNPGKSVITLVPLGGYFKGSVLYNNSIAYIPSSGGIERGTAYVIGRTSGEESEVHLQFIPPSGSFLPFYILVYPLDGRK
ncbi:MAG TPA: stalk domain-containing protein [Bacillota bacterium]|nr:stalk domain-containing protein [Bacillota bacterium]